MYNLNFQDSIALMNDMTNNPSMSGDDNIAKTDHVFRVGQYSWGRLLQAGARNGGAQDYLWLKSNTNRGFMKNLENFDITIKFAGRNWTFESDKVYCLDIQEKSFFMSKALEGHVELVDATIDEFITQDGVEQTYYW